MNKAEDYTGFLKRGMNRGPADLRRNLFTLYTPVPRKSRGVDFDIYDFDMIFNDAGTKKLIREGNTIGCFYIESPGMRSLLKRLSVETFELLVAASSIIRPGVAESGMMQEFIDRHKDPSRRRYIVPEMEALLHETYGVMVYQEDVLKVAHHIAGLSLEDADLLRRAMSGKLRSHKAMEQLAGRFFTGCTQKGLGENASHELWRQIESFAGYAFCKAHSASFALLSFQVAYLKVHYPAEFISSVLSNQGGYYTPGVYVQEAKRMGLEVLLPSVNSSQDNYEGRGRTVRIGLMAIKNLSRSAIEKIVKERKAGGEYKSLLDFLTRTRLAYEETAVLIRCGAMDCFNQTRPTLMRLLDIYIRSRRILDESYNDLFMADTFRLEKEIITDIDFSIEEVCAAEYEAFGYMVSRHPLEFFDEWTSGAKVIKASDMPKYAGRKVRMIGWYMTSKRIRTKKGDIMKFLSLEDLSGTFDAVLFPRTYSLYAEETLSMGPYIIEGTVDRGNSSNIITDRLQVLSSAMIQAVMQKDSAENKYFGDVEKVSEEEFYITEPVEREKLLSSYVG